MASTAGVPISQGPVDARQVVYEFEGIMMVMNLYLRMLKDRRAVDRARQAFKRLVESNEP